MRHKRRLLRHRLSIGKRYHIFSIKGGTSYQPFRRYRNRKS